MKRLFQAGGVLAFCIFLAGCGGESREGLISDTIGMMNQAAKELDDIQKAVAAASKEAADKNARLDLKAAYKAADKLKDTGDKTLELKARIEIVKLQISEQDRESYAESKRAELNEAFKNLSAKNDALRKTLKATDELTVPNAKQDVEELRKKVAWAVSPFEALSR